MANKTKGGSLTGLKASNKRVGPVDPKGAFTKVQEKTLAGAKGKAKLTADKQLGATKMKMGGTIKKAQGGFQNPKPYEKSVKTAKEIGLGGNSVYRVSGEGKILEKATNPKQATALKSKQAKDSLSTMSSRNKMTDAANRIAAVKKMKEVANRPMKSGGKMSKGKKC